MLEFPKGAAHSLLSSVASFPGAYSRGDSVRFAFYRGVLKLIVLQCGKNQYAVLYKNIDVSLCVLV